MAVALHELKQGDHIYTPCSGRIYYHHGIYVGKTKEYNPSTGKYMEIEHAVIHFIGINGQGKSLKSFGQCKKCFYKKQDGVVLTCIDCFLEGNSMYRYKYSTPLFDFNSATNGSCSTLASDKPEIVLNRAYDFHLGNKQFGKYDFIFNNCEHFATKCKTGFAICNQVLCGTGLPGAIVYNVARKFIGF